MTLQDLCANVRHRIISQSDFAITITVIPLKNRTKMAKMSANEEEVRNVHTAPTRLRKLLSQRLKRIHGKLKASGSQGLVDLLGINSARAIAISRREGIEHVHQILIQRRVLAEINRTAVVSIKDLNELGGSELANRFATELNLGEFRRRDSARAIAIDA